MLHEVLYPFTGQAAFAAERSFMEFFNSAIGVLQTLVIALGAGLGIWGVINLLEGYGNDNPGAKSQGIKQFMANYREQKERKSTIQTVSAAVYKNKL